MDWIATAVHWLGTALIVAATSYVGAALLAVLVRRRRTSAGASTAQHTVLQPVSILKPLYGAEPGLYENLRSFCQQSVTACQLIFGVRDPDDPAIAVVERLRREFPQRDLTLVVDPHVHGANLKVSNLMNMLPHAKHDWLVLADSDIRVPADYLPRVTAPLADAEVGIVTCLYCGIAGRGLWSRLGRLFIDDWFSPSVQLADAFGPTYVAFGSTIAVRRETLTAIGGFQILRDTLSDDFRLGELTRKQGLRTVLSDVLVATRINETRLWPLWTHELRWLRTIRSIAPLSFTLTFVCFTSPVLALGLWMAPSAWNLALVTIALCMKVALNGVQRRSGHGKSSWLDVLCIPLRDVLLLLEWSAALTGWRVKWHSQVLHARKNDPTSHV